MAFPRKLLNDGEEVVLDLRPHWWYMSRPTGPLVASMLLLGFVLTSTHERNKATWEAVVAYGSGALVLVCAVWFLAPG